jgi:hypothetical protein
MAIQLVFDDRTNPTHAIRTIGDRRKNKVNYCLLNRPFKDSNGRWVTTDRRSGNDRRL